mgnify:CR=1 FL=1
MEKALETYKKIRNQMKAYQFAFGIISWDSSTEAPKGSFENRSKAIGTLSEMSYRLGTSDEYMDAIDTLYNNVEKLDKVLAHEIVEIKKSTEKQKKIPVEEYVEYRTLMGSSQEIWADAKAKNDFNLFKPTLKKIVDYKRKQIKYQETDKLKGYDVLLDDYEPGFTTKDYDKFFDELKEKLVPFFKEINKCELQYNNSFVGKEFPREKQIEFCEYLQDVLCFNKEYGLMKESVHPFTMGINTKDVRFTNNYHEDDIVSAIFSAIHELGHAVYNQQNDPALDETFLSGGASNGIHESQSRLYENMIGRSREFWNVHFPKLKEIFPKQFKGVTATDFYKHVNRSFASFIRIEADELSYPLHIMLRYDLEKGLMNGEYEVDNIDKIWEDKFKEYFGLKVTKASDGILQDMHWGGGLIGYFPTYALGSAYAAQIYHAMAKDVNIKEELKTGKTTLINKWLKEKVHIHGRSLYPKEIIKYATGENFNSKYFIKYLQKKYEKLYQEFFRVNKK